VTALSKLGAHVASHEDALLEAASPDDSIRSALAQRAAGGRAPKKSAKGYAPLLWASVGIACGLAAGALFFGAELFAERAEPLSFTLDEPARQGNVGEWASAPPSRELPIRFSDGSALSLKPDARGRVVSVATNGAEVVIESGHALVQVVHRDNSDWKIRTGPFVVEVTGTRFEVGWKPQADELTVKVFEGSVRVSGCTLSQAHAVSGGQELRATCASASLSLKPIGSQEVTPPTPTPAAAPPRPAATPPPAAKPHKIQAPAPSWQELAHQGHYARAYELARAAGFEAECRRRSAADVLELADTARLAGHPADAQLAYNTVRSRFPSSDAAGRAAFALGRAAFQGGQTASAAHWFSTYLSERPGGPLASVALGRLLEAQVKLGDRGAARDTAQRYLSQYPAGPHAEQARKVLGVDEPSLRP
jgi:ferric-dicitrate binding protein FerR (iron transport regulator)